MTVRELTVEDIAGIATASQAWTYTWTEEYLSGLVGNPCYPALVAEDGGTPIGVALLRSMPPDAEVMIVQVAPAAQGQGIGSALLAEAVTVLKEREWTTRILALTHAEDVVAQTLYGGQGFILQERGDGVEALLLV